MYSSMESFAMDERIDGSGFYLGLLTKLAFSTGDLNDAVKMF